MFAAAATGAAPARKQGGRPQRSCSREAAPNTTVPRPRKVEANDFFTTEDHKSHTRSTDSSACGRTCRGPPGWSARCDIRAGGP